VETDIYGLYSQLTFCCFSVLAECNFSTKAVGIF